ncbi:ABC-2 type transport system permease protein [Armatimonadetes bacterium GBS]|jgi:ABC-2 type transport system permease protein|nr:MAG: ABC transporter permease [Fimbriimonadales bacterium]CUU06251.1 ABC-2 type transport system permease protein [Armatimonadetes bacterium GBS]CUU35861.1 ABC-2 type transport system permease protein [Armatimonadetes bacterium GXS]
MGQGVASRLYLAVGYNSGVRALAKFLALLRIYIEDSLAYRASAFIWMLTDIIHCLVMPLVWLSAYNGKATIGGYNPGEMVTYYVLMAFVTNFIVSHLMWDLSWEIKEGVLSQWLLRPVPVGWMLFARNLSWRAMRMVMFLPMAALALWYYSRFTTLSPLYLGWEFWLSVLLGHLVSFWVAYALACLAFWLQEVQSVFSLYYVPMLLLSGWVAPIALMPEWLQTLASLMPFRYTTAVPTEIALGKLTGDLMWSQIGIQGLWVLIGMGLTAILWRAGLRQYTGVGM